MPECRLFSELNREQVKASAEHSLALVPLGATEQHGPHLATGMDLFAVEALARAAAERASARIPVVVTPALPFGSSDHHFVFGATLSLSTETYYRVLRELVASLATGGFTRIFLLNGHGGNHEIMQLAARDVALAHAVRVGAGSYWRIAWDALVAAGAHRGRRLPGHAGDFETSLLMALRPELVAGNRPSRSDPGDTDPRPSPYRHERHGFWRDIDGYTDNPAQATREKGEQFWNVLVTAVAGALLAFYES
jgi:creatinine amidohydrolase